MKLFKGSKLRTNVIKLDEKNEHVVDKLGDFLLTFLKVNFPILALALLTSFLNISFINVIDITYCSLVVLLFGASFVYGVLSTLMDELICDIFHVDVINL